MNDALHLLNGKEFQAIADCKSRIVDWLNEPSIDEKSKQDVRELIVKNNVTELRDRFYRDLEFGTGGLRGVLGAGSNRMNQYIIARATQGLSNTINKSTQKGSASVAIAHDSRNGSAEFARVAATVFAANGITAHLFPTLQTTPCLSFAIRHLKCISGICVTASHNPPQYNGFKVYWDDGAQVVPPRDKQILNDVLAIQSYSEIRYLNFDEGFKQGLIRFIGDDVINEYLKALDALRLFPKEEKKIQIAYTPLHGTGAAMTRAALTRWNFLNLHIVPEQEKPDGNFPTVKKPNPEEPEALKMLVALAEKTASDIALATDPDSDRLALVVRDAKAAKGLFSHQAIGDYILLNGNQTGALLIDFILNAKKAQGSLLPQHKVVKTIVTSELHRKICEDSGVEIFETLTGFKWIAALVRSWEETGKNFKYLFGTEESFGFMPGDYVRDKDGIGSLCQTAELANHLKLQGKTACDRLLEMFQKYGAWQEDLINIDLAGEEGAARISRIMNTTRNKPLLRMAGSDVARLNDYKTQKCYIIKNSIAVENTNAAIDLPPSDVLQFELSDGSRVSMRPSGTEPKLKIYVSVCTKGSSVEVSYRNTLTRIASLRKELETYIATIL